MADKYHRHIWTPEAYRVVVELYSRYPGQHVRVAEEARRELQDEHINQGRCYRLWRDGQKDPLLRPIRETLEVLVEEERLALEAERDELPVLAQASARRNLRMHVEQLRAGMEFVRGRRSILFEGGNLSLYRLYQKLGREIAQEVHQGVLTSEGGKPRPMDLETKWTWFQRIAKVARDTDDAWANLLLADKTLQGAARITGHLGGGAEEGPQAQNPLDLLPGSDADYSVQVGALLRQMQQLQEVEEALRAQAPETPGSSDQQA